jgi:hypothetical protein
VIGADVMVGGLSPGQPRWRYWIRDPIEGIGSLNKDRNSIPLVDRSAMLGSTIQEWRGAGLVQIKFPKVFHTVKLRN